MKKVIIWIAVFFIFCFLVVLGINMYVSFSTSKRINKIDDDFNADCILILGAGVWGDEPSPMLKDRLDKGIELYNEGYAKKIIMSGDHGRSEYDEVNIMKEYAISKGVPSQDIFMDHAGFSTYDSLYRLKYIFEAEKVIIVSQKYHLYRSVYIAKSLGLDAYGINANPRSYSGANVREIREVLARNKDFFKCIFKPKASIMGDTISLDGSGDVTNDK